MDVQSIILIALWYIYVYHIIIMWGPWTQSTEHHLESRNSGS